MEGANGVGLVDGARVALLFGAMSVLFAAIRFARQRLLARARPSVRPLRTRVSVAGFALLQAIVVLTLCAYFRAGGWTLDSAGVSGRVSPAVAFLTGLGEFGLFTLIVA